MRTSSAELAKLLSLRPGGERAPETNGLLHLRLRLFLQRPLLQRLMHVRSRLERHSLRLDPLVCEWCPPRLQRLALDVGRQPGARA